LLREAASEIGMRANEGQLPVHRRGRMVAQSAAYNASAEAKGRFTQACSATHGECSNRWPSAAG